MEIDYEVIGQRIKKARLEKGLTQERLSEEIDVTTVYISRIERGSKVNLERLAQIARVLGVTIEYLLTGAATKNENYLDKDLYDILKECTPKKQRLIYNIAQIVCDSKFV